jgi:hypothetical protein
LLISTQFGWLATKPHADLETANKHLQTTLIEAAKMAPRYSPDLAALYDLEKQKGMPIARR